MSYFTAEKLGVALARARVAAGLKPSRHGPPYQQGKGYGPELGVWGVQPTG